MKYQRNPSKVKANLKVTDDGAVYTTAPCTIQIPERYATRHLASIGNEVFILGFFALIMEDSYYAVSTTAAMMRITPSGTDTVVIDDVPYYEFSFDAGDRVIYSTDLVRNDTLTYYIYDEHVAKGRVPWYFTYEDLGRIFLTDRLHAGTDLGSPVVSDLIISTTTRNPEDLSQLYRHEYKGGDYSQKNPPKVIPFRSVIWNTSDTTSKLIGAYFTDSINSALVNHSDRVERIEELLRT